MARQGFISPGSPYFHWLSSLLGSLRPPPDTLSRRVKVKPDRKPFCLKSKVVKDSSKKTSQRRSSCGAKRMTPTRTINSSSSSRRLTVDSKENASWNLRRGTPISAPAKRELAQTRSAGKKDIRSFALAVFRRSTSAPMRQMHRSAQESGLGAHFPSKNPCS